MVWKSVEGAVLKIGRQERKRWVILSLGSNLSEVERWRWRRRRKLERGTGIPKKRFRSATGDVRLTMYLHRPTLYILLCSNWWLHWRAVPPSSLASHFVPFVLRKILRDKHKALASCQATLAKSTAFILLPESIPSWQWVWPLLHIPRMLPFWKKLFSWKNYVLSTSGWLHWF